MSDNHNSLPPDGNETTASVTRIFGDRRSPDETPPAPAPGAPAAIERRPAETPPPTMLLAGDAETASDLGNAARGARLATGTTRREGDRVVVIDAHVMRRYVPALGHFIGWASRSETAGWWEVDIDDSMALDLAKAVIDDVRFQAQRVGGDEGQTWGRWALHSEGAARINAMLNLMKQDSRLIVSVDDLDANAHHLVVENGTVDLDDLTHVDGRPQLQLISSEPFHLNTRHAPVPFEPDVTSEELNAFLNLFLPPYCPGMPCGVVGHPVGCECRCECETDDHTDERAYVLEKLSDALPAKNQTKTLLILLGPPDSGKSTLMRTLMAALGEYVMPIAISVFRGNHGDKPRPDLLDPLRSRIAYAVETSKVAELHGDQIKRLTGNDPMTARAMRSDVMVHRVPDFTPVILTNEMFELKGADDAARGRLTVLWFPVHVERTPRGERAAETLVASKTARTALLARLLNARAEKLARGRPMLEPIRFAEKRMEALGDLSEAVRFVRSMEEAERLVHHDPASYEAAGHPMVAYVTTTELHQMYLSWHQSLRLRTDRLDLKPFNEQLRAQGWETTRSRGLRWRGWVARHPALEDLITT